MSHKPGFKSTKGKHVCPACGRMSRTLDGLLDHFKIVVGGIPPRSPQENANAAWALMGRKMGFDSYTVQAVGGKSTRFFTAVSNEPTPETP